ncbi:MAG: hypothetical protein JXQ73_17880 [Phycisphaerae bacterium]|nr:hypothetical protein [Phycisphaerae bacterium]
MRRDGFRGEFRVVGLAMICLVIVVASGRSDVIVLKNGKQLRGEIAAQTDSAVQVRTRQGRITVTRSVPRGEIRSIRREATAGADSGRAAEEPKQAAPSRQERPVRRGRVDSGREGEEAGRTDRRTLNGEADPAIRIGVYPSQTAIANRRFEGEAPVLGDPASGVTWSLAKAPEGMIVDPQSGIPSWDHPIEGQHDIVLSASNDGGHDAAEWVLRVVKDDIPDARIVQTRYIDFVVPARVAEWMGRWHAAAYVDACWERMRDTIGQEPGGRQIVKYDPSRKGGAHSGNPVEAGPLWWRPDPVKGWTLGAWLHEVGHNFHAFTRIGRIIEDNPSDRYFHHGCEFTQVSMALRALEQPADFGLPRDAYGNLRAWVNQRREDQEKRSRPYLKGVERGGRAGDWEKGHYQIWSALCYDLCERYGTQVLTRALRALRTDGLPVRVYELADTNIKKDTLLFCILSCAAGEHLLGFFDHWGFDADGRFHDEVQPLVSREMARLPNEDEGGWKRCPLNGHRYRLTRERVSWREGERVARRLGGHLATVRDAKEDEWLRSRFERRGALWIGLSDRGAEGQWRWTSGESLGYTHWAEGEPNGGSRENDVAFNWRKKGIWNDCDTNARFFAIIEVSQSIDAKESNGDRSRRGKRRGGRTR